MAAEDPGQRALVGRLELVVELVADPRADLLARGLDVQPGRDPLHQPQDDPQVLHVRPHGRGDARVLHLDRHLAPVVQARAVDLADRGGGDRLLVELGDVSRSGSSSSDSITLRMSAKRTFGAASRSSPSLRWNSSRCSSGTSPTSRKLITCPSFIAAPFIVPSAVTICSAASMCRRSSAASLAPPRSARGWPRACPGAARPGRRPGSTPARCGRAARWEIRSLATTEWPSAVAAGGGVALLRRHGGGGGHGRRGGRGGLRRGRRRRRWRSRSRWPSASPRPWSSSDFFEEPPNSDVERFEWLTEWPNTASSDAVTTPDADHGRQ